MKVLIADDDRHLTGALAVRFRQLGMEVAVAHDGFTTIELARREMPDVICLDVEMPGGNGLAVCEMLTSDESFLKTPVIMLTGRRDHHTIRRCHELCAYYIPKGCNVWEHVKPLLVELRAGLEDAKGEAGHRHAGQ